MAASVGGDIVDIAAGHGILRGKPARPRQSAGRRRALTAHLLGTGGRRGGRMAPSRRDRWLCPRHGWGHTGQRSSPLAETWPIVDSSPSAPAPAATPPSCAGRHRGTSGRLARRPSSGSRPRCDWSAQAPLNNSSSAKARVKSPAGTTLAMLYEYSSAAPFLDGCVNLNWPHCDAPPWFRRTPPPPPRPPPPADRNGRATDPTPTGTPGGLRPMPRNARCCLEPTVGGDRRGATVAPSRAG